MPLSSGIPILSTTTRLPSHKETGIGAVATREANESVKRVLEKQAGQQSAKKQKRHTNFSVTDRAEIGQYADILTDTGTHPEKTKQLLKNNGTYSATFTVVILHKAGNIHYRCFSRNQPTNVHWSTSTCPLTTPTKSHPHKFNYCDFLCDTISTRKIRKSKVYAKHYSITVAKPVS